MKDRRRISKKEQIKLLEKSIEKFGDYDGSKARKITRIKEGKSK